MRYKRFVKTFATVLLIALPVVGFTQRQYIYDEIRLYGYTPPQEIAQLASDTTMDGDTRKVFYVHRPTIEDKSTFNTTCQDSEQTIVLGCYIERQSIHILNIEDERLAGVEQVTAAHEILHALYDRLDTKEKARVDTMTASVFNALNDDRIKETIEQYRKKDPSVVPNELHSILGTEIRKLPSNLEAYYARYFIDRSKIVSYSEKYERAFTDRKNQIKAYDAQLESLKQKIDSLQAELEAKNSSLTAQRSQLEGQNAGQSSSYRAAVSSYNQNVNAYNKKVDQLTALVSEFNDIVPKRNEIVNEEQDLVKAIDSRESVPGKQ